MFEGKIYNLIRLKAKEQKLPPSIILITQEPHGGLNEAREIVRISFCLKEGKEDCNCPMCYHLKIGNHPDYFEIGAIKNQITIEQIRELREEAQKVPFEAKKRFFVLKRAHQLNIPASNCFLKILEEPNEKTHFILLTSQPNLLLPTIRSRCHIFPLPFKNIKKEVPEEIIKAWENFSLSPDILNLYIFIEEISKQPLYIIPSYLLSLNFPSTPKFLVDISFEYLNVIVKYPHTLNLKLFLEKLFLSKWYENFYNIT